MTTPAHRLRQTIDEVIAAAHPRPVPLDEVYRAVESSVVFDAGDLAPPNLRGGPASEPSWKRNVRNVLQHAKQAGALVNIQHNAWRLPSPDPRHSLDASVAWPEVHRAALKALADESEFTSTKQAHRYRITAVAPDRITIQRLDSPGPEKLTTGEVTRAIRYLNAAGGRVGRGTLMHTVAKEVTLVHLHPRLAWSDDRDWIESAGVPETEAARPVYRDFGEAPNDDPEKLALFSRRVRAGQPKFRRNLLAAYGKRCAISGWGPVEVLEAAHILLHAHTGLNKADNGVLLRSDLHVLFDEGLLRIDPDSLRIWLDPSLAGTPYWDWNGASLRPRVDGSHPSREYLRARWEEAKTAPADGEIAVPVG